MTELDFLDNTWLFLQLLKFTDKKYNYILDNTKNIGWGSDGEGV
jgi:hypothetical protein